ncbi:DsbA family protein [Paramicrobacterium agarici]|uniref:Protein-disulfide isomerase n=1 Tax=Paramicrobacterium agarici TaxID=630514 RepID=A0A2A9DWR6_9MICO|nr:thioredoxin domain-containing protein [Microbacterium agarici]PFG30791.1 protein-disulfide isomerase [Microbacterium agarici]TQO23858.1 protein-disulfide isomerase [Microbacterium agarici]
MAGDGETNKASKRTHVREKARQLRETQRKRDLRNRVLLQGGIGVLVIAAIVAVVMIVVSSIKPETPGPKNMASDGIVIGQDLVAQTSPALAAGASPVPATSEPGVAHIRVYVDYLCPWCGQFERTNVEQIEGWLNSGAAVLEVHPIAVLTSKSQGTEYSLRAANAAACVANSSPDSFFAFNRALFENQPEEGTSGLTDDQLVKLASKAGASSIADCVEEQTFASWVQAATERAVSGPLPGTEVERVEATPTVLVNGLQYKGSLTDEEEFHAFVIATNSETLATTTPSPSVSPTDEPADEK